MKNKGFSAINILGLALGLAACLLIVFYVADELSYDRYNDNTDRIYRVNSDLKLGDNRTQYAVSVAPLAATLKRDFPEVEDAVRIRPGVFHVKKGTENIREGVVFADASLFNVFTLPMLFGNKEKALSEPNTVVISETAALRYFNKVDVVGQVINIDNDQSLKITGVIKDMPKRSHFTTDFFESMASKGDSRSNNWIGVNFNTYLLFRKGADARKLEAQFPQLIRKYAGSDIQRAAGMNVDAFEKGGSFFRLHLMPLTDIHLRSNLVGEMDANGNVQYVYIFSAIALFILLIACVNFINLSTARSSNRAREVGVRKVLGSSRGYLIAQFLSESVIVTLTATLIALVIVGLALSAFNDLAAKNITINGAMLAWLIPTLLIGALTVGCIAGIYPAVFLSGFQPVEVLKGKLSTGFKGSRLRSLMVIFQFAVSIFLIIGTLVVYRQIQYIQKRDIGYNRDQVLVVNTAELGDKASIFKQEAKQLPGITDATLTGFLPTAGYRANDALFQDQTRDPKKTLFPELWDVDHDYIKTLDMKLAAGRDFSPKLLTDSNAVIINETAANALGAGSVLNKILYRPSANNTLKAFTIIGVVRDFNFNSLRQNITPVALFLGNNNGNLGLRVSTTNLPTLISKLQSKWKALAPSAQFNYSFMDADFEATYRTEQRMGQIFIIFTSLAIIIACLGLFGLSAYAAEQRTKEIGIRKVLGANISTIVRLLSLDFIKLVFISILIATPIAWWAMNKWLQDFAYRINIQWWVLVIAGSAAMLIAFMTISFQSISAALANPVDSLRSE
jgi:putative ABC transport system permease protein